MENKELEEAINDFIKSYKQYSKDDNADDIVYCMMQSSAIKILRLKNRDYHISYHELYNQLLKERREDKDGKK